VHCRQPYEPSAEERAFFEQNTGRTKTQFWHGAGCNLCSHTGYSDRIGVYELLPVTESIKQLVLDQADHDSLRAQAVADGMHTLRDEALRLIEQDVTTVAEALRSVYAR
jgi:type IV pilus assembly protein PilB